MTAFGEECLAQSWEEQKIFDTKAWLDCQGDPLGIETERHITRTRSNETERFFEAGRVHCLMVLGRKILVRQSAPLSQCVKVALELGGHSRWVIIA